MSRYSWALSDVRDEPTMTHVWVQGFTRTYLRYGHLEVVLRYVLATLTKREHAGFRAHRFALGTRRLRHLFCYYFQIDSTEEVHLSGVDTHDIHARCSRWIRKFDLPIDAPRPHQRLWSGRGRGGGGQVSLR